MDDVDVGYSLDPSGYLVGVNQIDRANAQLQRSMGTVVTTSAGVQRALSAITPSRALIGGLSLLAAGAAQTEQSLSTLAATSVTTGSNYDKLAGGIRSMARDMPLGAQQSKALVEQLSKAGVAAAGSETKVLSLSRTFGKLGGSTGENVSSLAQGMVELSRATGNSQLDPKRVAALADSLTTVSAKSGASATGILQFSKAIAPLAQSSGIGATGVLGISSAFAKIGEDGFGASTAVNKMLSDLNRSVREGSPELKTYAMFVGKSADEFERLFKAKPAEALTQVTEAIAKAGPGGPRMLEQIGVEGVRGQRALQALVSSGGLRESISTAVGAYGSGSTDKASEAAFGGLNDSLTELRETSSQLADAFGQPLLAPLAKFTDLLKVGVGGLADAAQSGPGQGVLTAAAFGGAGLLASKSILGVLGPLALGRQAVTSGPLRSVAAGIAGATGSTGFLSRFGAGAQAAYDDGRMGPVNRGIYERSAGFGQEWQRRNPPTGGPGLFSRMRSGAAAWGGNAVMSYTQSVGQQFANAATTDPFSRRDSMRFAPGFQAATAAAQNVDTRGMSQFQAMRAGMSAFNKELQATTGSTVGLRQQFRALGSMVIQQGRAGGALVGDAARGIGAAGGGLLRSMGPGLALTAGIGGAMWMKDRADQMRAANEALPQNDIAASVNAYRESIGKATDSTKTFGSLTAGLSQQLAKNAELGGFDAARRVTDEDRAAAEGSRDKKVRQYGGTNEQIASQIQTMAPSGVSADELQAIKVDLLRQRNAGDVASIMKLLPNNFDSSVRQPGEANLNDVLRGTVGAAAGGPRDGLGNFLMSGKGFGALDGQNGNFFQGSPFSPGGALYRNPLGEASMGSVEAAREGVGQQFESQSGKFGVNYAMQERLKSMNVALKEAYDQGNTEVFYELSKRFGADLGADPNRVWSANQFAAQGFDFSKQVAGSDDNFKKTLEGLLGAGAQTTGQGGLSPQLLRSIFYDTVLPESGFLSQAFDSQNRGPMSQAMSKSLATPADVGLQENATRAIITGAQEAGKSMSELAIEATKSANAVAEGSDAWVRLKQVQQRAEQQMAYENANLAPGEQQIKQWQFLQQKASIVPQTEQQRTEVEAAKGQMVGVEDAMRQRMVARLQVQRQLEISEGRANEDFNRSKLYAEQDYQTQVYRTGRSFMLQLEQSQRAYRVSTERAEEDFSTSRLRTMRDFHKNARRAEQDYQLGRFRQIRDFNKSLRRAIEDAASSMYDPYSRIQAKPTWDAANLTVNLKEQTASMRKQLDELQKLRDAGLSSSAIDQLGLGKAENAQQVNNLALDLSPQMIAELNAAAKARAEAAGQLYVDESNKDLRRQREDLLTAMKDQEADFKRSMERQRADLNTSLRDANRDFSKSLRRQSEDFAYNLAMSRRQLAITLGDMATDRARSMARSKEALNISLKRMKEDVRNADQAIAGSMSDLAEQTNRAIHGKAVRWQKILKNDTSAWVTDMQKNVIPRLGAVFSAFGVSVTSSGFTHNLSGANQKLQAQERASGGAIEGYSPHDKADNIPVWATGGEFMHNVAAVKYYGKGFMEALNAKRIPKEHLMGAQGFASGGWINPVAPARPGFPWGHYPSGRPHRALDYPVRIGTPVHAPYAGDILQSGWSTTGFGNHIRMKNEPVGTFSILGHMSRLIADVGDHVRQGQLLGYSGSTGNSTGPHLHLEMRRRLNDPLSAYNFTTSGGGGGFNKLAAIAMRQPGMIDALFAGMKSNPGGIYGELTEQAKGVAKAVLYDKGGIMKPGYGAFMNGTGKPEKVLTDEQWASISQLAALGGHGITQDAFKGVKAAGGVHIVINNHQRITYDNRNDFAHADITVVSNDPDDMARKLEKRQTQQRITQTRGVRRGTS